MHFAPMVIYTVSLTKILYILFRVIQYPVRVLNLLKTSTSNGTSDLQIFLICFFKSDSVMPETIDYKSVFDFPTSISKNYQHSVRL